MTKSSSAALIVLTLLTGMPAHASNLLVNGDFENQPAWGAGISGDAGYTALTGTQLPGWVIETGHAVTIHNTVLYPTISGGYSVNMDGEGFNGGNANLYQDVASVAGTSYTLSFQWSTWFTNTQPNLDVSITDTSTSSVLYHGNFAWLSGLHTETANFVGTGNTLRLRVMESPQSGFNDNAYVVDNFSLVAAPVPEPGQIALLLAGLGVVMAVAGHRERGTSRDKA